MAAPTTTETETIEAVIISGPRKGEFITVPDAEPVMTPQVEALLDQMIESVNSINHTLQSMNRDTAAFVAEMRERRREREELLLQTSPAALPSQTPENTL